MKKLRDHIKGRVSTRLIATLVMLAVVAFGTGCDKELSEVDDSKIIKKLSPQELDLISASNQLSFDIIKAEFSRQSNSNLFFSPVSTSMALGMIYNTVGETEKNQIQRFTGWDYMVEKEINKSYNEFISFLQISYDQMNISYANSIWFDDDITVNEHYRTKVMAYYDAEISEINFKKKGSLQSINNWGSLKTGGTFDQLTSFVPPIDYNIYLVNAFALQSGWSGNKHFKNTGAFTDHNGASQEIDILNLEEVRASINHTDLYEYIEVPLKRDQFYFSAIVPEVGTSFSEMVSDLSVSDIDINRSNAKEAVVNLSLPDLDFYTENTLKETLSQMGLHSIFTQGSDLSPSFSEQNLSISEINQVSRLDISSNFSIIPKNEFDNPALIKIEINKPFLYFVTDRHTRSVLFAGYYTHPDQ